MSPPCTDSSLTCPAEGKTNPALGDAAEPASAARVPAVWRRSRGSAGEASSFEPKRPSCSPRSPFAAEAGVLQAELPDCRRNRRFAAEAAGFRQDRASCRRIRRIAEESPGIFGKLEPTPKNKRASAARAPKNPGNWSNLAKCGKFSKNLESTSRDTTHSWGIRQLALQTGKSRDFRAQRGSLDESSRISRALRS